MTEMKRELKLLLVNDDGIDSEGIVALARLAATLGKVTVAAPAAQCSGMSQRITISPRLEVRRVSFPVAEAEAYRVNGTPADCVMAAVCGIMEERPDYVFSGINTGYNTGIDILYSGTIGAAMEGLVHGVPSIAFSIGKDYTSFETVERHFHSLMDYVQAQPPLEGEIWNFNFPDCPPDQVKGVLYDRVPAREEFYGLSKFTVHGARTGEFWLSPEGSWPKSGPSGTDMGAVLDGYISVGRVKNAVLG